MKNQLIQLRIVELCLFVCGLLFSAEQNLQAQPVITNEPVDVATNVGRGVFFRVGAMGSSLAYRWRFSGTNVSVGGAAMLSLPFTTTNSAGNYFAIVSNVTGTVTSRVATLTFLPPLPPVIANQPMSVTTNVGASSVKFTVNASGTAPLGYRWWFSGTNVSVGSSATLTLNNIQSNKSGDYFAVVTNSAGAVTSSIATLTVIPLVLTPPFITSQPVSVTTNVGETVGFTVGASGSSPLTYRWWFTGTNGPIGGTAILTLVNAKSNNVGDYFAVVTNSAGAATSSIATLTLYSVPATNSPGLWLIHHSATNGDILKLVLDLGKNYRILSSPDMITWSDVTNFFSDTSLMYFTNSAANNQTLFYRLASP